LILDLFKGDKYGTDDDSIVIHKRNFLDKQNEEYEFEHGKMSINNINEICGDSEIPKGIFLEGTIIPLLKEETKKMENDVEKAKSTVSISEAQGIVDNVAVNSKNLVDVTKLTYCAVDLTEQTEMRQNLFDLNEHLGETESISSYVDKDEIENVQVELNTVITTMEEDSCDTTETDTSEVVSNMNEIAKDLADKIINDLKKDDIQSAVDTANTIVNHDKAVDSDPNVDDALKEETKSTVIYVKTRVQSGSETQMYTKTINVIDGEVSVEEIFENY